MTNILDIHPSGGRRRDRRAERVRRRSEADPRPRWAAPVAAPAGESVVAASEQEASTAARNGAPAFRRLVVFGSVDATAKRPAT